MCLTRKKKKMNNEYLHIEDGHISFCDNVFSGCATLADEQSSYYQEMADRWRYSEWANYDDFTLEQREEIARRWEKAKDLPDGEYDYYFNLDDLVEVFKKSVDELAKTLGIDYELKINEHE